MKRPDQSIGACIFLLLRVSYLASWKQGCSNEVLFACEHGVWMQSTFQFLRHRTVSQHLIWLWLQTGGHLSDQPRVRAAGFFCCRCKKGVRAGSSEKRGRRGNSHNFRALSITFCVGFSFAQGCRNCCVLHSRCIVHLGSICYIRRRRLGSAFQAAHRRSCSSESLAALALVSEASFRRSSCHAF